MSGKILFIDRDGTLIEEPADFQIDSVEKFKLLPDVIPSLLKLKAAGYRFVMVSNQDGLGTEKYPAESFALIQKLLLDILQTQGIAFEAVRICPHFESERCLCRKPQISLVKDYLATPDMDRKRSAVIGDRRTDVLLAENMGIPGILLSQQNGWKAITDSMLAQNRVGACARKTRETEIGVRVNLDDPTTTRIATGIGFFDHMLDQIAKHGGFGLEAQVKGDLHIDDHHTVEDTGLALGSALRDALSDKVGIGRYGFLLPMDESQCQVALDLSGRAYFRFEGKLTRDSVGGVASEMFPHFFRSLSDSLGANLHIRVEGENTHHMVESMFKAVGRSLRQAIARTDGAGLPSTKGLL